MPELTPGELLGGCRVEAVIARGGMGVVYRAVQLDLERPVALKVITADRAGDPEFRERFERESRMAAAIDHPNVVPVYAAGEDRGALYIVMRYVAGSDLHALIKRAGPLPAARATAIVVQVAAALDAAHAAGLVHRDVKPANVLLPSAGEHAYLSDFGLMRSLDPQDPLTESGSWIGTVDFASPEQLDGERVDARSDVYSLGCVLYAALTGAPPFPRGTVSATMLAHLRDPPPQPSTEGLDAGFDRVIARALAKAPDDRYPSAGDLGRAALGRRARRARDRVRAHGGDRAGRTRSRRARCDAPQPPARRPPRRPRSRSPAPTRVRVVPDEPPPARRRGPGRRTLAAALALPLAGIVTVALLMVGSGDGRDAAAASPSRSPRSRCRPPSRRSRTPTRARTAPRSRGC